MRLYLETSVINAFYSKNSEIRNPTRKFFNLIKIGKHNGYASKAVIDEINLASKKKRNKLLKLVKKYRLNSLQVFNKSLNLALKYIDAKLIPRKVRTDAIHIAVAAVNKMDAIVSWNLKHIVNINTIKGVNEINKKEGYSYIAIITPEEVV